MSSPGPRNALVITYRGHRHEILPSARPYRIGRDVSAQLRLPDADTKVSRRVCSVVWVPPGQWAVFAESDTHPVQVRDQDGKHVLGQRGDRYELHFRTSQIQFGEEPAHEVDLCWPDAPKQNRPEIGAPVSRIVTDPFIRLTDNDRNLLAAKFLSLTRPGDAVGNKKATEIADLWRAENPDSELPYPIGRKAVENCVRRLRERLTNRGVSGVSADDGANRLGRYLVQQRALRRSDRHFAPEELVSRGVLGPDDMDPAPGEDDE